MQPSPTPPTTTTSPYKYYDNGWILNQENNKCYTRVEEKKTFADASIYCVIHGGQLASIHSADENEFILDLPSNNQDIGSWIGLEWINHGQCVPSGNTCDKVGQEPSCPYWSDGAPV
uniref:C-type lectin domain-containing protein n=1 Tax=Acrobeloides nanus TaxID=290746 RepID=A0A914E1G2_9BILA